MRLTTLLVVALVMVACNTRPSTNGNDASVDNSHDDTAEYRRYTYEEIADKAEFKERITGDFNGDGATEDASLYYYRELFDEEAEEWDYYRYHHYYYVVFGDDAIPTIDVEWSATGLTNEGDLDGDGADDIGYFQWGGYSACGTYLVFSLCDGEWRVRVGLSHNEGWNEEPYDALVRKDPSAEGYVIVREIQVEAGGILDKRVKLR